MEILLVPDKFKDSLDAKSVINALKGGILSYNPSCVVNEIIASDGGDGFLDAVHFNNPIFKTIQVESVDALKRTIFSKFLFDKNNYTAYIELANTCGLYRLPNNERNPIRTTTIGCGLQIKQALQMGAKQIYIGLGGSATNDAGIGIAYTLGYRFYDINDKELEPIGGNLIHIKRIEKNNVINFRDVTFFAVNDVENVLYGTEGAALVYGKQKGANLNDLELLDLGLKNIDKVVQKEIGLKFSNVKGSGAAGGVGYGLKTFLNAGFISGIDFILKKDSVINLLKSGKIDLIVTGEGKIDNQTVYGKLVKGVADISNNFGIPVIAICGLSEINEINKRKLGVIDIIEIACRKKSLEYNLKNAYDLIKNKIQEYLSDSDLFNNNF